jgi:hypothetical protein
MITITLDLSTLAFVAVFYCVGMFVFIVWQLNKQPLSRFDLELIERAKGVCTNDKSKI